MDSIARKSIIVGGNQGNAMVGAAIDRIGGKTIIIARAIQVNAGTSLV